ncbi:MAG: hypothetical protein GF401_19845 [Chitinivibrionales bacterium]|nr:hypothetical protein [Chitinivibrionales bacterium]
MSDYRIVYHYSTDILQLTRHCPPKKKPDMLKKLCDSKKEKSGTVSHPGMSDHWFIYAIIVLLLSCSTPENPVDNESLVSVSFSVPEPANAQDSTLWELSDSVRVTLTAALPHFIDSIIVDFGDGHSRTFDLRGESRTGSRSFSLTYLYAEPGAITIKATGFPNGKSTTIGASLPLELGLCPKVMQELKTHGSSILGASYALSVEYTGSETCSFTWMKNGMPLSYIDSSALNFSSLEISDSGSYRCAVSNKWGSDSSTSLMVIPKNDSSAPVVRLLDETMDSSSCTDDSIRIGVIATDDGGIDRVRAQLGIDFFEAAHAGDSLYYVTVYELKASQWNDIQIIAYDNAGKTSTMAVHVRYSPLIVTVTQPTLHSDSAVADTNVVALHGRARSGDTTIASVDIRINSTPAPSSGTSTWSLMAPLTPGIWNRIEVAAVDHKDRDTTCTFYIFVLHHLQKPLPPERDSAWQTGMRIRWNQVPHCTHYRAARINPGSGDTTWLEPTADTTTIDNNLIVNTTYTYIVRGLQDIGGSFGIVDSTPLSDTAILSTAPYASFQKVYGGIGSDAATGVFQCDDGGYFICGYTESYGIGGRDVYLVRTNQSGETMWTRTYGGIGDDIATACSHTPDGYFVICGYSCSFSDSGQKEMYLLKVDAVGDTLWTATCGTGKEDAANDVCVTADGGYALCGYTFQDTASGNKNVALVKFSSNGTREWTGMYGDINHEIGFRVKQIAGGGFILAGQSRTYTSPGNIPLVGSGPAPFVTRTGPGGEEVWSTEIDRSAIGTLKNIQPLPDGGFIIAGETAAVVPTSVLYLSKTDQNGAVLWTKTHGAADSYIAPIVVNIAANGDFVVAGSRDGDAYAIRTTSSGDSLWANSFGGNEFDQAEDISETADGGYVLVGSTLSFGAGNADIYLIKTDPLGNSPSGPQ